MWDKLKNFVMQHPVFFILMLVVGLGLFTFLNIEALHLSSTPQFCGTCHPEKKAGPLGEYYTWSQSLHGKAGVECLDCHGTPGFPGYMKAKLGGMKDLFGEVFLSDEHKLNILTKGATDPAYAAKLVPNKTCLHCHSDAVNELNRNREIMSVGVKFRKLDEVENPAFRKGHGLPDLYEGPARTAVNPNHKKHIWEVGLSCADCHLGVVHAGDLRNRPAMDTCFECHDSKRKETNYSPPDNNDCGACHTIQKTIQEGTLIKNEEPQPWYMASLSCNDCHMDLDTPPTAETCKACHEDADYSEMITETQNAYEERLAPLTKLRDQLLTDQGEGDGSANKKANSFKYLVDVLEMDGSRGMHNPEYFETLLEKAESMVDSLK